MGLPPPTAGADEEVPVPGFAGLLGGLEVVWVGLPPPTGELVEVSVLGSLTAAGEVDVDGSPGSLDAVEEGTEGELVAVVGSDIDVVVGMVVEIVGRAEATLDEVLTA